MKNLTLLIPAKFEAESLPTVLIELKKFNYKACVILKKTDLTTIESIKNFDVEVIEIRKATTEELEHKHVHGPGGHKH